MPFRILAFVPAVALTIVFSCGGIALHAEDSVDFALEVRPILSDHCFACHGPDEHERQAVLRLDVADGLAAVIDEDDLDESELIARIRTDDPDIVMPPPEYRKPLTAAEKRTIETWLRDGATFRDHWAFEIPVKADVPADVDPIDHFIDTAIARKGLSRNGRASDAKLLRRVCLDLTGLPPTREQIERVKSDSLDYETLVNELLASRAFGQHVGRHWLDLVRYADTHGLHLDNYREMWPFRDWVIDAFNANMSFDRFIKEQLAGDLLPDATLDQKIASGYNRLNVTTSEGGSIYDEVFARNVIDRTDAFGTVFLGLTTQCSVCHDHKFDPITQKDYYSLSAFFNSLDGQALDGNKKDHPPVVRVPTLQQTHGIAELDQQLADLRDEMSGPIDSVDAAQRDWEQSLSEPAGNQTAVLTPTEVSSQGGATLAIEEDGSVRLTDPIAAKDTHTFVAELDESLHDTRWRTVRLEVLPDEKTDRVGVASNGNAVLTEFTVETKTPESDQWQALKIKSAKADIEQSDGNFKIGNATDGKTDGAGWAVAGHQQTGSRTAWFAVPGLADRIVSGATQLRVKLHYHSAFANHQFRRVRLSVSEAAASVSPEEQITAGPLHVAGPFTAESAAPAYSRVYASQQKAFKADETFRAGQEEFGWQLREDWDTVRINDLPRAGENVSVNVIHQSLTSPKKQSVTVMIGSTDGHTLFLNGKVVAELNRTGPIQPLVHRYKLDLKKGNNDLYLKTITESDSPQFTFAYRSTAIAPPNGLIELASRSPAERSPDEALSLRTYYREVQCTHPDWTALQDLASGVESARDKLRESIATTLVWKELAEPRKAHILVRGQYDQPGEEVPRNTPGFLPPLAEDAPRDRRGLAEWLVASDHPLTARVAVNRFWQMIFGTGLVRSSEDFGNQGEPPSHPRLLDWLAVDFRENGWDVKRLIKQIVMSEAYRRDAAVTPAQFKVDPNNTFYARGPRHRLDGEVLRDQALALAGLLKEDAGGPSVKPPQPEGLWYAVGYTNSNTANFKADVEPGKIYRRSVYIFWKRTSAPPQMSTFDAPSRESCTARRERTNTPLQALLLMNEIQYLQSSKHLAARALNESGLPSDADRLRWLFETVTARQPTDYEQKELQTLLSDLLQVYSGNEEAIDELLAVDESEFDVDDVELAAWMMVASTLLNLDEVVNK